MTKLVLFAVLATTACVPPETVQTGPEIEVHLESDDSRIDHDDEDPALGRADSGDYEFTLVVTTRAGTESTPTTSDRFAVTELAGTLAIPDIALPAITFEYEELFEGRTFTSSPIVVPGTALGQRMAIAMTAHDERGLASNPVAFEVALAE